MNEVRQAWSSLRSPARSSSLIASGKNNHGSSATWYDVPAPVIIHCREFREDETAPAKVNAGEKEDVKIERNRADGQEASRSSMTSTEDQAEAREAIYENNVSSDIAAEGRHRNLIASVSTGLPEQEVLYQNNVEAALNSLSKVCEKAAIAGEEEGDCVDKSTRQDFVDEIPARRRLSSSVELKATTTVKTDENGLPVISFSFLQTDEKGRSKRPKEKTDLEDERNGDEEGLPQDQLYDVPKSPRPEDEENRKRSNESGKEIVERRNSREASKTDEEDRIQVDFYDVPKSIVDKSEVEGKTENGEIAKEVSAGKILTHIDTSRLKSHRDKTKRSTRSLKTGRRSYGAPNSDGFDAGVASISGSYSDPECQDDASTASAGGKRLTLQKRRLGKAWGKMRSWLREEKTKIGEVVAKHAKFQAVGAMSGDLQAEATVKVTRSKCVSYDLTKARTQELGSITRVEEFGLTSVSEESKVREIRRSSSKSPDSGKPLANECSERATRSALGKKTASSDDILGAGKKCRLPSASFSLEKLCSETEEERVANAGEEVESTSRDHSGKGGLIKRRMLGSIRGLMASTHLLHAHEHDEASQGGFEDVRRYIKQGGDFCKDLAAILHERAELEATYAKGLSKLSSKLTKACAKDQGGNSTGGVNEAWRCVGEEMEAAAEAHKIWGIALEEQLAKPLRVGVAEAQGRSRKSIENSVDKASKSLQEWRVVASKSKKQSFACARENERLQDLARLQSISQNQHNNNNKSSNHHMTEKEASKLESRRRKAEDSSRRADTEFYTVSVRAERARLEYENTVRKGAKQMELLEEERLSALKDLANVYLAHLQALAPRLQQSADRLSTPVRNCNVSQDVEILKNLIRRIDSHESVGAEQLLPDFYAEHITLAMNRERRKQALVRVLHLIRQDLERERRGREGLETLHRAFIKTPAFAADESTQNVTDKLHHMRSMLMYLEAARYKVGGTLAEVEGSKRGTHPLAEHILVSRDKQGLQQSVLKIPSWAKNESFEFPEHNQDELEVHLSKDHEHETRDWADRTAGDGNSENPPDEEDFSDFDEFSSQSEDNNNQDVEVVDVTAKNEGVEQCRAIYQYSANLNDELSLSPGDLITVHQKQADGWWIGECRGRTGIFPATYVQVIH